MEKIFDKIFKALTSQTAANLLGIIVMVGLYIGSFTFVCWILKVLAGLLGLV